MLSLAILGLTDYHDGKTHVYQSLDCFVLPFEGSDSDAVFKEHVNKLISKVVGAIPLQKEAVDTTQSNSQ
jgi:hypothetical protein